MSTKINVRSPFYLHLVEPSPPLPDFDCTVAGLAGFAVDNQGIITLPSPAVGVIDSISSDDGDFSNNKFPTESTDTSRTIKIKLLIPTGYANTSDIFFECPVTATQQGTSSSVVLPTVCSGGPSANGSISSKSLSVGGSSIDVALAGFFTNETTYDFSNLNPNLVTVALSGSTLTLSPNVIAGSTTVYAIARDNNFPATCEKTQSIAVSVSDSTTAFSCTEPTNPALQGGSITQQGAITKPSSLGSVGTIRTTSGDPSTNITSYPANTGTAERNVDLFFDITVPSGYSNATAIVECEARLVQKGTSAPEFTCKLAGLTGQSIARNGSIFTGTAFRGTVKTPASSTPFPTVDTDTSRTVNFPVTIPSGYQNAGSDISGGCDVPLIQPATVSICGSNNFYLSTPKTSLLGHCSDVYSANKLVTSTESSLVGLAQSQICEGGVAFDGKGLYYGVFTSSAAAAIGAIGRSYYIIQIDSSGIVIDTAIANCDALGGGSNVLV
tara:strand:+ start:430 stop:1920 length:1491 start_codon:yes stop_codon:yes gene_type:complete